MCTTVFQAYHTMYVRIHTISVLGIQGWGKAVSMEPWNTQPAPTGRVESACCSGSEGEEDTSEEQQQRIREQGGTSH